MKATFYLRENFFSFEIFLYLPYNWNFVLIAAHNSDVKIKNFYFFSFFYYFWFPFIASSVIINYLSQTRTLSFKFAFINSFFRIYWLNVKQLFNSFSYFFFKKLKFKGKGYYIFKNKRNTITFRFGYSHRIYLYFYGIIVKFLSKTSIFMFGIQKTELFSAAMQLRAVRPYNIFTGKGVRFTRQVIYKKIGKVGSYR